MLAAPFDKPYDFAVAKDPRTFKDLVTAAGLVEIKTYADGVGPWKPYILPGRFVDRNNDGKSDDLNGDGAIDERDRVLLAPTKLIEDAHRLGLFVHTWTMRNEPRAGWPPTSPAIRRLNTSATSSWESTGCSATSSTRPCPPAEPPDKASRRRRGRARSARGPARSLRGSARPLHPSVSAPLTIRNGV